MIPYTSRPYAAEDDYQRMRELLVRIEAAAGPLVYCHLGDLDWWRFADPAPDAVIRDTRLWFDAGGALVAFGWPREDQVDIVCHPAHQAAEAEILSWAVGWQRAATPGADPAPFIAWSYEHDSQRNELLRARGYQRGTMHFLLNARGLPEDPPPPLPPGYSLRHVRGEQDVAARVEVHRDAFAPSRMTVEKHRAVMAAPTYRPDLDLVVEAPDGTFAAFCLVWLDAANRAGEFEPVGCHSAHRRLGLTKAVLYEGMRRLRALGAEQCAVFSSSGERYAPSRHLYASAGFEVAGRIWSWERILPHWGGLEGQSPSEKT
jgi:hypothetical protein